MGHSSLWGWGGGEDVPRSEFVVVRVARKRSAEAWDQRMASLGSHLLLIVSKQNIFCQL